MNGTLLLRKREGCREEKRRRGRGKQRKGREIEGRTGEGKKVDKILVRIFKFSLE